MFNLNETTMIGRLTRDPEIRHTPSGKCVTNFGVVTNRSWKQGEEWREKATFSEWIMWNGYGEAFAKIAHKGDVVYVSGEFGMDEWEAEGEKRSRPKFTALTARVLIKAGEGKSVVSQEPTEEKPAPAKKRGRPAKSDPKPELNDDNDDDKPDEDIPF